MKAVMSNTSKEIERWRRERKREREIERERERWRRFEGE